jgi:hypothetical protein
MGAVREYGILVGYAHVKSLFSILLGNGRVLGALLNGVFFYYFRDNPMPFAIFALVIQTLNSYLAYLVAKKITKNNHIAFITACVFSVPAAANQAVSWFGATTQTLGGMTFVFLALLAAIQGITWKKKSMQIASWVLAYIAFLFKESSFFVFPLLLVLPYVVVPRVQSVHWKKYAVILAALFIFGSYKTLEYFGISIGHLNSIRQLSVIGKALFQMVYFPLVSLGQFFIPAQFMHRFAPIFARFTYGFMATTTADDLATSVIVADMLSIMAAFILLIVVAIIYAKRNYLRRSILFILCWYVASFVPISVFTYQRGTSYVESRYLYFSYFPVAMMVGFMLDEVRIIFGSIIKNAKAAYVITYIILTLFLYKQVMLMQRGINENIVYGNDIKSAMQTIRTSYPVLPAKPIFFVEGDRKYFFDNNVLPFKLGTGYMLLLTFKDNPQISGKMIGDNYLYKFFDQGYKEIGDKGFGYFWNKKDLLNFFRTNKNLSVDQLVGIYYYGNDRRVLDTTSALRKEIIFDMETGQ